MAVVLGVEMSALSTKVEVRDADDGRLLASGRAQHPGARPGRQGYDPTKWWHAVVEARNSAAAALGVNAVAVAAQSDGVVLLDADGRAIRPADVGSDDDIAGEVPWLIRDLGGTDQWMSAIGTLPDASSAIAKLAWLRRTDPASFAKIRRVLLPHDYLTYRMARRFVTDRGDASTTGYWSPRENRWRADLLELVDPDFDWSGCLPAVLAPNEAAGDREGVLIGPGTGAQAATALGIGLQPHDVVISLDRSSACFALRERPTADETGMVSDQADATGRFLPVTRTFNARDVMESMAALVGIDLQHLDPLALSSPPGAAGVRFVPFRELHGAPVGPGSFGWVAGLHGGVQHEHVARALVEGVVCALLEGLDALRDADVPVGGRLFVVGHAARSHAFQRVFADLAERPVYVPGSPDAVCLGACIQAAAVFHELPPEAVATAWGVAPARVIEPDERVDAERIRADYAAARV